MLRRRRVDGSRRAPLWWFVTRQALLALGVLLAAPAAAWATDAPCAACVVWRVAPGQAGRLAEQARGTSVLVPASPDGAAARDALASLRAAGAEVGLELTLAEAAGSDPALAGPVHVVLLRVSDDAAGDRLAFDLKRAAVAWRAENPAAEIGVAAAPAVLDALLGLGVTPYVDFVMPADGVAAAAGPPAWRAVTPSSPVRVAEVLDLTRGAGNGRVVFDLPPDATALPAAVASLARVLPRDLGPLDALGVACAAPGCATEAYLDPATLDAVVVARAPAGVRLTLTPAAGRTEVWLADAPEGTVRAGSLTARPGTRGADVDVPPSPLAVLRVSGWTGRETAFASGLEVRARRSLTIEEVVARHQAAAARQARRVPRLVAAGTTTLTFQVPGLAAPMTLTARTTLFRAPGVTEIAQADLRLNGVEVPVARDGVPRLPLLEPERVSTPPLTVTLDAAYRYRLAAPDRVEGRECEVVAFEPRDASRPGFRGRAWIDALDFGLVRLDAVQTGLRGAIVSSRQVDEFTPRDVAGTRVWLLRRSAVHQMYEGPAHRTPIDRVLDLAAIEVDPPDFAARWEAAHTSPEVMLRETAEGWRYLRRAAHAPVAAGTPAPARRVAAPPATRVRSVAVGLLVDPNISRPLPFAGLSYLDFDFLGTGAQVNAFAAGPFLQAAWTVPSLGSPDWRLHGSAFASLVRYHDRAFRQGIERFDENLRQRPLRGTLAVVRRLGATSRLRLAYEGEAILLEPADTTSPEFRLPADAVSHGLRFGVEWERAGWTAVAWTSGHWRPRWPEWGAPGASEDAALARTYTRAGVTLGRAVVFSPQVVGRLEGGLLAGRHLDRFSRFTFDNFDSRLRGYASAALRFDRGVVARSSLTWSVRPGLRADAFLDGARVRDPGYGRAARGYVGFGAALEAALPGRALLVGDWGYGAQGRDRDGRRGTHVLRITAYKVF
jgi:hypothetical protein